MSNEYRYQTLEDFLTLRKITYMNSIGNKILEIRKSKGLTQEELAELSKVNLRTIQRIENNENEPRGKTLNLICDVLEIKRDYFTNKINENKRGSIIVNGVFLVLLNLLFILTIALLVLNSNVNSKVGAFLLSFFIPFFIVVFTQKMSALERTIKFGGSFLVYIIARMIIEGFQGGLRTGLGSGLYFCIIILIGVLYYGKIILKLTK